MVCLYSKSYIHSERCSKPSKTRCLTKLALLLVGLVLTLGCIFNPGLVGSQHGELLPTHVASGIAGGLVKA